MPRHPHPSDDGTDDLPRPAPGDAAPRWPGAPEPKVAPDGTVTNAVEFCRTCDSPSTLSYRCSECGADLADKGSNGGAA